jgi:CheY-like chemotaxis protein
MKKKALIIEDEESIREYMCFILENIGFTVVEAKNGKEGLEQFSKGGFSLVVTDMVMPGHGGSEILKEIRRTDPNMPVVAISGAMSYRDLLTGAGRNGADAVVQKPFTENEFIKVIRRSMANAPA